jgi:hypothetical protein
MLAAIPGPILKPNLIADFLSGEPPASNFDDSVEQGHLFASRTGGRGNLGQSEGDLGEIGGAH